MLPLERVEEHKRYRVIASGVPVVLLCQGTQVYAISAMCPMLVARWMKECLRVSRGVFVA